MTETNNPASTSKKKRSFLINFMRLTRLPLLFFVVAIQFVTHYSIIEPMINHADGEIQMGALPLALCIIATVCITLGGFWVNDYFDVKIDRINRQITRVVDLFISRDSIFNLYIGATAIAIICAGVLSYIASAFDYFFIFIAIIGLLWFYSSSYKRTWGLGSLMLAISVAMIPIVVCLYDNWFINQVYGMMPQTSVILMNVLKKTAVLGGILAAWTIIIDIIRAMIEEKGEREMECHSLPIVFGHTKAKVVCYVIAILAALACGKVALEATAYLSTKAINFFLLSVAPLTIGLLFQLKKSTIRLDYLICTGIIHTIIVCMLIFVVILGYYYE
ncbi:MAG: UbiA family prenyltransferase [Paludibacteraceae bacterium]|nr:UbiA family prenyltransferase [Paludibacteraceae bacterium]